jgi:hypothetical protein
MNIQIVASRLVYQVAKADLSNINNAMMDDEVTVDGCKVLVKDAIALWTDIFKSTMISYSERTSAYFDSVTKRSKLETLTLAETPETSDDENSDTETGFGEKLTSEDDNFTEENSTEDVLHYTIIQPSVDDNPTRPELVEQLSVYTKT